MSDKQYLVRFGPNANCTFELCTIDESVYGYRPSLIANITFIALFSLATLIHTYLGFKWKTWWFMWCLILSCTHEVAGYIGRVMLYYNPWSFVAFLVQIIAITQAPVFYCAAIYVTLAQTIHYFSPTLARFPPNYIAWIFVPCDIISLVLQGVGGGMSASSTGSSTVGVDIAMAGLIFQIITLVVFSGLFGDYLFRYLCTGKTKKITARAKLFFSLMTLAVVATLIRCIFRADELKEGYNGELIKREDLFIALEGVLVIVAVFSLCIGHPGIVFKDEEQKYDNVATIESTGENGMLLQERGIGYAGRSL